MLKNYFKINENENIGSFLKEIKDKKHTLYIILDSQSPSYVDIRTAALKISNPNEKLKNLKTPLSVCDAKDKNLQFEFMANSGQRVIIVNENNYYDFIDALNYLLNNSENFLNDSLETLVKEEIFALNESDSIAQAKKFFIDKKINLLPIIDEKLEVIGELRPMDFLLYSLTGETENKGLHSSKYTDSVLNLPVINLMNPKPLNVHKTNTFKDAIKIMIEKKLASLIIMDDNQKIHSIISYKDIFKKAMANREKQEFKIEYIGMDEIYEEESALIVKYAEKFVQKVSKISDYDNLKISFKTHGNTQGSHLKKVSLNITLSKGQKILHVAKEISGGSSDEIKNDKVKGKWNIPLMFQDALKSLEKQIKEEKSR